MTYQSTYPIETGHDEEHKISIEELCDRFKTDVVNGLSTDEAKRRLIENGPNSLPIAPKAHEIVRFLKAIFSGFSILLWLGAVLCIAIFFLDKQMSNITNYEQVGLASALVLVATVTGLFAFYQEGKSEKVMHSFMGLIPDRAQVIRNRNRMEILARELVLGDILIIQMGDKISADVRIIESQSLKTDHSIITGECDPLERFVKCDNLSLMETSNLAFFGTFAVEGSGKGIVVKTGGDTLMGKIACLTSNIKRRKTTFAVEIERFILILGIWALCIATVFFIALMSIGYSWSQSLIFFVGIIIANIPEGLLATLTLSLTLASQRMAVRNCLIKKLEAVESLGNTSIVCSDKTGTLTQNRMTVAHLWYNKSFIDPKMLSRLKKKKEQPSFQMLRRCAILCSRAEFKPLVGSHYFSRAKREVIGDPSESAVIKCKGIATEEEINDMRKLFPKVFERPFNSTDKVQVSIHKRKSKDFLLVMKGAPEKIISCCSKLLLDSKEVPITQELYDEMNQACDDLASDGERVLAFCDWEKFAFSEEKFKIPTEGARFLGLISLIDPPRPNVPEAVLECRRAGIKIIMITGDHRSTARAIAKQVNIISEDSAIKDGFNGIYTNENHNAIILEGQDLLRLTNNQLDEIIDKHNELVFARTSPKQKLEIVESCQRLGAVVAVTGDGVNDSPALKKADIGVAMGIAGSAVAKQSAEIILLDDNFATLVRGIEEGRLVFVNLRKSIGYTLTHNVPEMILLMTHIIVGIPLPLGIITVLFIDIGTDMWSSIALAYEEAEMNLMDHLPRDIKKDRLVNRGLLSLVFQMGFIEVAASLFAYFIVMAESGWLPKDLVQIKTKWMDRAEIIPDSYNTYRNYDERLSIEHSCYTAVFTAIVLCQMANAIVFKNFRGTKRAYSFKLCLSNVNLLASFIFSIFVLFFLSYVPAVSKVFRFEPLRVQWWLPALPFAALMIIYHETVKKIVQKHPDSWFSRNMIP